VPPGIKFVRVDLKTGLRAASEDTKTILEAFKPDEEPDDGYSMIGFANATADASAAAGASPYQAPPPPPPPPPQPSARQDGGLAPNGFW
jgi:penicillin-binding protein 1A